MAVSAVSRGARIRSAIALVFLLTFAGVVLALAIGMVVAVISAAVSAGLGTE
jgi:flagellar biosynthesis protein FliQ